MAMLTSRRPRKDDFIFRFIANYLVREEIDINIITIYAQYKPKAKTAKESIGKVF